MEKILFLTNNLITQPLYEWINAKERNVVIHSGRFGALEQHKIEPGFIISYNYRYILQEDVLQECTKIINLHTSLLPWNRGADPNFWSFMEDTPKGVTIHFIDKGIDTGDILLQREIFFDEKNETLLSTYHKLHAEMQKLVMENWVDLKNQTIRHYKQAGIATFHKKNEFEKIKSAVGENIYNIPIYKLKQLYRGIINDKN